MRSKDLARIVHDDESLYMPAHTPYELQTLFEELAWYVRRYGSVQLELNQQVFTVRGQRAEARCGDCDGVLMLPSFQEGDGSPLLPSFQEGDGSPLCVRCASARMWPRFRRPPVRYGVRQRVA